MLKIALGKRLDVCDEGRGSEMVGRGQRAVFPERYHIEIDSNIQKITSNSPSWKEKSVRGCNESNKSSTSEEFRCVASLGMIQWRIMRWRFQSRTCSLFILGGGEIGENDYDGISLASRCEP